MMIMMMIKIGDDGDDDSLYAMVCCRSDLQIVL